MKIAIMQPYFLPYIGYFQLAAAADRFVLYDNIEYTKKGWINRNRILLNGRADYITIPLKKDSDYLFVNQRSLSDDSTVELNRLLNRLNEVYRKAPYYYDTIELLKSILTYPNRNLFEFIKNSLEQTLLYLNIKTPVIISSSLPIDPYLKAEKKVIAICKQQKAICYINPIGGMELYHKEEFLKNQLDLKFIKSNPITYKQLGNNFVPWLSIVDVLMFNHRDECSRLIHDEYQLINNE